MKVFLGGQRATMNQSTNNTEVKEANYTIPSENGNGT